VLLYTGSGRVSRFGTSLRLGIPKDLLLPQFLMFLLTRG